MLALIFISALIIASFVIDDVSAESLGSKLKKGVKETARDVKNGAKEKAHKAKQVAKDSKQEAEDEIEQARNKHH